MVKQLKNISELKHTKEERIMKDRYEKIQMEIIEFNSEDIITTSGEGGDNGGSDWGEIDPGRN